MNEWREVEKPLCYGWALRAIPTKEFLLKTTQMNYSSQRNLFSKIKNDPHREAGRETP
jgi:hypothetical protein